MHEDTNYPSKAPLFDAIEDDKAEGWTAHWAVLLISPVFMLGSFVVGLLTLGYDAVAARLRRQPGT